MLYISNLCRISNDNQSLYKRHQRFTWYCTSVDCWKVLWIFYCHAVYRMGNWCRLVSCVVSRLIWRDWSKQDSIFEFLYPFDNVNNQMVRLLLFFSSNSSSYHIFLALRSYIYTLPSSHFTIFNKNKNNICRLLFLLTNKTRRCFPTDTIGIISSF